MLKQTLTHTFRNPTLLALVSLICDETSNNQPLLTYHYCSELLQMITVLYVPTGHQWVLLKSRVFPCKYVLPVNVMEKKIRTTGPDNRGI